MRVGEYELVEPIGRGGTAEVFRARAPDGREVAVKVLSQRAGDAGAGRSAREARLASRLGQEDGFVAILDAGESPRGSYLVMPLLRGSLRGRLKGEPLPIEDVLAIGRQAAAALARAHAAGIVHRDIKPENLLFDDAGRWLVADLGLAKHFRQDAPGAALSQVLTRTGDICGTAGYLAPEQLEDSKSVGPAADVFALGSVLYECLAGRPAFDGATPLEVLARLAQGRAPSLAAARPDAPRWLVRAIEAALDPSPARRLPDGAALARALEAGARPPRGRRRAALAGALAAAALGLLALTRSGPASATPGVAAEAGTSADEPCAWQPRIAPAVEALGRGDPAPALRLLAEARGAPPDARAATARALAGAAVACAPPADDVLDLLLAREPEGLVDPACADWLLARAERLLSEDPAGAARAVALAARADVRRAPPAGFESALRTTAGSRYVAGAPEAWLDLALAGLAAGANHGLFPTGVDLHFEGGLRGALERRLQERADDWPAALHLSLALLRTNREPDDLERGAALARRVLEAPDLTPHGRAFALEALGKHLLWSQSSAEAVACFEAALSAWHPRPDEVCLEASRCQLDLGRPAAAVPWAERAVDLRDRRARGGPPEEGRPPGMPLASMEGTRGAESFRLQARTTLLDRLLRAGEHVRAEQVILELGEQPWPGVVQARLGAVALAAVRGLREEAHERARALSADPTVEARLLRNEAGWVRTLVVEVTGDRSFARALARDLGAD